MQFDMDSVEARLERLVAQITKEEIRKAELIIQLNNLADELDAKRDLAIAKTSVSIVGIVSVGLAIGGIVAVPFTFGASLGLTIAGTVLGVYSGLGTTATIIAEQVSKKKTIKKTQEKADQYREIVLDLVSTANELKGLNQRKLKMLLNHLKSSADGDQLIIYNRIIDSVTESTGIHGIDIADRTLLIPSLDALQGKTVGEILGNGVKSFRIGGMMLSTITVPIDIVSIVHHSIMESPSEMSQEIRRLAKFLLNSTEIRCDR